MARPDATGRVRVIAGKTAESTTCRFGATDLIEGRLYVTAADPVGEYVLCKLPREATSTPVDRSTLAPGESPIWDDLFLPPVGTPLWARPSADAGTGRGLLTIDGTTIPPVVVPVA